MKKKKPKIDLADDYFGAVLNCAVRYAIGRQTYMPSIVVDFIQPLLPYLNLKTLQVFIRDISGAKSSGLGDRLIDEPLWLGFHEDVINEIARREQEGGKA